MHLRSGEAYSLPPTSSWWEKAGCFLPKNSESLSAFGLEFQASEVAVPDKFLATPMKLALTSYNYNR